MKGVPCYSKFFQFVQWHNNAFATVANMQIPELVLRYEDYHDSFRDTVLRLFDFLGLDVRGRMNRCVWNGGYSAYFTNQERDAVENFMDKFGSERTKKELKNYFEMKELDGESTPDAIKMRV